MPKLSEIELREDDILVSDVPDTAIAHWRLMASALNQSVSDYVVGRLAVRASVPREKLAGAEIIVLDPE